MKIFTEGLYAELKNTNVGVTVFHPGAVNTNIMSNSGLDAPSADEQATQEASHRTISAQKAAAIMIDAIEKNKFRATVGKDARMLDIYYRLSPKSAIHTIVKSMSRMK